MFFSRRTDLPLDKDVLSRFMPWLIAFMVYLAALAQAGMVGLDDLARRWDTGLAATMTVQIPADPDGGKATDARRLQKAMNLISDTPGVLSADVVPEQKVMQLLSPWLGVVDAIDVPLPHLIDVEMDADLHVDARVLQRKLSQAIPGAQVDDHGVWLGRLIQMVRTLEGLAGTVLMFILLAATATVVFTTRTGLTVHHDAIEVLHLTGAHDSYIAKQFAGRALATGLRGGLYGIALAVPTLLALGYMAGRMEVGMLPEMRMPVLGWVSLALLPVMAALVAGITARITVMRNLRGMI